MNSVIGIHQPNFFPWLGYFDKIINSDIFIMLDNVQFPKKGGVWTNRVQLLFSEKTNWATASINRSFSGFKNVNEISIVYNDNWNLKLVKSLYQSYSKHPFFDETINLIEPLLKIKEESLSDFNIYCIREILDSLELKSNHIKLSSELNLNSKSNELLIDIIKSYNANIYLCGGGSEDYLKSDKFLNNNISIRYQNFNHPVYPQKKLKEFTPGLSIIDCLMNIGIKETSKIIKENH